MYRGRRVNRQAIRGGQSLPVENVRERIARGKAEQRADLFTIVAACTAKGKGEPKMPPFLRLCMRRSGSTRCAR
jgi:hypothetical protein